MLLKFSKKAPSAPNFGRFAPKILPHQPPNRWGDRLTTKRPLMVGPPHHRPTSKSVPARQSVTRPEIFDRVRVREFWVASLGGESGSGNFQILFPPPSPSPGISSRKKRVRDQIFGVKNNKMTCKSIENYKSFQSSLVS